MKAPAKAVHALLPALGLLAVSASAADLRLIEALKHGDLATVGALIKQVDVNAREPDGATALLWAAQRDDVRAAALLIQAGANVNLANEYGVTPLSLAATNGSAAMIAQLLGAGADANGARPSGVTPLMTAARTGRLDAVAALLAGGADVQAAEHGMGQTALIWALSERHGGIARLLVEHGAHVEVRSIGGFTPLLFAARQGDLESARWLLAHGADVNAAAGDGTTALHMATVRGHVALAEFLLDQGADANASAPGYTPLHWAAGTWETATTRDYGVREWEVLAGLSAGDKARLIRALLAHGANPNAHTTRNVPRFGSSAWKIHGEGSAIGATPFFYAAASADIPTMLLLIANGGDPLLPTNDHTTPLIATAGLGIEESETRIPEARHLEALRLLVALGGDIEGANDQGNTALHAAAFLGYDSIVQYLVDKGVALNPKNQQGQTPYKIASGIMVTQMFFRHPSTEALLRRLGGVE
jgi:ankyrin repeat protein